MASFNQKGILGTKKKLEIQWFKDKYIENGKIEDHTIANKNKTKILISLKHHYSKEFLETLLNQGFTNFHIDGSRLNLKIYNKIVSHLIDYAETKLNTRPTIIFDLKSPLPLITKISENRKFLKIYKGQTIKISYETKREYEGDVIYIDKKISQGVNIGDILLISYPELRLKVVGVENSLMSSASYANLRKKDNYSQFNQVNCIKQIKSSPSLFKDKNTYNLYQKQIESYEESYKIPEKDANDDSGNFPNNLYDDEININIKKENNISNNKNSIMNKYYPQNVIEEDEEYLIDPNNFDNFYEETLKHKHDKLEQSYQKIMIRYNAMDKELLYKDNDKFSTSMDKISAISQIDMLGSLSAHSNSLLQENKKALYNNSSRKYLYDNTSNKNKLIICEALEEGVISEHISISMVGKNIMQLCDLPNLSPKDINDLNQTHSIGINIISSHIEQTSDIDEIKEILGEEASKSLKVFAIIETKNALVNFDSILEKADGIIIQKLFGSTNLNHGEMLSVIMYIIQKCKIKNKPIILKINSLKSININIPVLSKMPSLDFSVKQGIDSVIIHEENINFNENEYLSTINAFRQILLEIEAFEDNTKKFQEISKLFALNKGYLNHMEEVNNYFCLMECAAKLSYEIKVDLIILYTDYYLIGKVLSHFRPYSIIAFPTADEHEVTFLRLFRGVIPFHCCIEDLEFCNREISIKNLIKDYKSQNLVKESLDKVIVVNAYCNKKYKYKNSIFVVNSN